MTRVRFGVFEFDADTSELRRDGVSVRLQPQPARVLALLLARAGELVTRDELRQKVWGDETFVDFERGLNFAVAQIRSALGDSASSPRFIETVPRRGYRFIAPVLTQPANASNFHTPAIILSLTSELDRDDNVEKKFPIRIAKGTVAGKM